MYRTSDDLRFAKNRDALQRAFIDLVLEKRTTKVSVSELASRARVNRMTFYSHYESVADVLAELVDGMVAEIEASQAGRGPLDITTLLQAASEVMGREIDFFRVVAVSDELGLCRDRFRGAFRDIFEAELAGCGMVDADRLRLTADVAASGVTYVYFDWLRAEYPDVSQDELAGRLEQAFAALAACQDI